jgi:ribosome-associated protein
MIQVTTEILLYDNEIEEKFIRSPGSGGQKVNKTATSVQLRFHAKKSSALTNDLFLRLKQLAGQRMTNAGVIVISAHKYSTQEQNRQDALRRLVSLIRKATIVPKVRRKTMPTRGSNERRLDSKRQKSNVKKGRGKLRNFD